MKKTYIKPEMEVMELNIETLMISMSAPGGDGAGQGNCRCQAGQDQNREPDCLHPVAHAGRYRRPADPLHPRAGSAHQPVGGGDHPVVWLGVFPRQLELPLRYVRSILA